jgi:S-sulfo-L-cysteine synthase (3-phospho-L-serine-dependent)
LIFVESNTSGTGCLFLRAARERGFEPLLLTTDLSRYKFPHEEMFRAILTDTSDVNALLYTCRQIARDHRIAGVASSSEYFVEVAASLAARLGLPGPDPISISQCRNKERQRERLQESGLEGPSFQSADSVDRALKVARSIGLPVVLKPLTGSGSVGVLLCETMEQVQSHAEKLLSRRSNERGLTIPNSILVETMVQGPEFSVETFGNEIIGVTKKYLTPPPRFVETGHDFPAALSLDQASAITQSTLLALKTLDLHWGAAHTEVRLSQNGPIIIEVNPRLAGGYIPELVRLSFGIDLISSSIDLATDRQPILLKTARLYSSIRFIMVPHTAKLVHAGLSIAAESPGVVDVRMYHQQGAIVQRHNDFRDRIGHVIACGDSSEGACQAAEQASDAVKITFEAGD